MGKKGIGYRVVYEDNHLLVVDKDAGILVQGDQTGDIPLVERCKDYLKEKYHKPGEVFLGVVHRLDRPVSGIVVLARTSKGLERMNALFREKQTRKIYWAIVQKKPEPEQGTLIHWLRKDEKKNKTTAYNRQTDDGLKSELNFRMIGLNEGNFLVEVNPLTGRPHQIRVQLSSLGCPIKGDVKYGAREMNADGSICLHARTLEFVHPVKKIKMRFEAPLPNSEYWSAFKHIPA